MAGTGCQSEMHATDLQGRGMVTVSTDSEEDVCIPQLPVKIPLDTFGSWPPNRSGWSLSPAHTHRLLRSVQLMNSDEKPMMMIQAVAKKSIAKKGKRMRHWAKEPHNKNKGAVYNQDACDIPQGTRRWENPCVFV